MIETKDIYWLAGLLEGEGSFSTSGKYPHIQVAMGDADVVQRAHRLLSGKGPLRSYSRYHSDGRTGPTEWYETRNCWSSLKNVRC